METSAKIDAAIAKVTKAVKRLEKADRNSHGGYNFAGIDDFLAMTGKLCGDAGLSVIMDEDEFEIIPEFLQTKNGKCAGLRMRFAITMRCDGESVGPFRRSVIVPANMGSQAFGAAESYVLKRFLRATFQIPTGDKGEDIDAHDTGEMRGAPAQPSMPPVRITEQQRQEIASLLDGKGIPVREFCEVGKLAEIKDLSANQFAGAKAWINAQPVRAKEPPAPQSSDAILDDEIPF